MEKSDKTVLYVISKIETCGNYCSGDCEYVHGYARSMAECRLFNISLYKNEDNKVEFEYFRCNGCLNNAITSREI